MKTRTGSFPIGFRRGGGWQKDLPALLDWAKSTGFETIDLTSFDAESVKQVRDVGLQIGSADLRQGPRLLSTDPEKLKAATDASLQSIRDAADLGVKNLFTVFLSDDRDEKQSARYARLVEHLQPVADAAGSAGVKIVVEGWPGPAPHYPALCCTPETVRAMLRDVGGGMALNYDPSHLVRLGVDPLRFLREFLPHVGHVHAKDTALMPEALYEYGLYQPAAFADARGFGEHVWRYTIPGHGVIDWPAIAKLLADGGYSGALSVELEDEHFNGSEAGEKMGLERSLEYLAGI